MLQNIRTVFTALKKHFPECRWQLPLYMACQISEPLMATLIPSLAIRMITEGELLYFLAAITAMLVAYWVRQAVGNITSMYLNHEHFYTTKNFFFMNFIKKALTTDYLNIEPQEKQKLVQRADTAVYYAQNLMNETIQLAIKLLGMIFYGFAVFTLDIRILLTIFVFAFLDIFLRKRAIRYDGEHWFEHTEVIRKRNYLERSSLDINAGKDIRIYRLKDCFHTHFCQLIEQERDFQKRRSLRWYYPSLAGGPGSLLRDGLAYGILIGKVLSGELDVAGFTLYLGVISGFTNWIYPLTQTFSSLEKANVYFGDYNMFMNLQDHNLLEGQNPSGDGKQNHPGRHTEIFRRNDAPSIEFRDVSFSYENSGSPVLSHLNFTLQAGEKVALVGGNGAGKTTLVKLLCGLYPVTSGEILINGKKVDTLNLDEWREKISVVFQDAIPMAFSVAMNVSGQTENESDRSKIKESLQHAGLWEKIESLPNHEDTYLTQQLDENGILLSGGELQKLLLARAVYKNGSVLILDEPTAALDPLAESAMYEEYNTLAGGK
ncbi:MAG: ABC transporter ATP-binding protein/permease, partial [Lachnospiraceae bacterium]|nr:ABC transporter ATP-binding protein/permease [Lachnospiraceae bacterium]